jgi:hypothetical protein
VVQDLIGGDALGMRPDRLQRGFAQRQCRRRFSR